MIVLGWNFSPTIGHDIEALGQGDRLEVLVIPPDLLDRLKKKGHKLKADEVRFSSLQYLKLGAVKRDRTGATEDLSVSIATMSCYHPRREPGRGKPREAAKSHQQGPARPDRILER